MSNSLVGQKFGELRVVSVASTASSHGRVRTLYNCRCECGNKCVVAPAWLTDGAIKNCGSKREHGR
jgi:hypothetical protein